MKAKRLITLILASMAVGALAGCGAKKSSSSSSQKESSSQQSSSGDVSSSSGEQSSSGGQSSSEAGLPDEYSLMKYWAGNQSEETYTVTETATQTKIVYTDAVGEDAGGWEYVARSFAYDVDRAKFGEYKKISFTGKLEVTSGSDVVMVKVEGAGGTFEKRFNFANTVNTYEFSLNFVTDWTQVTQILFFANRSTNASGSGVITLDEMVLSKEEVNPDYDIAPGMPDVPQGWNYYNGEDDFTAMYRWGYNAEGYIQTEESELGGYVFSWSGAKESGWAYVSALVDSTEEHPLATSGLKRVVYSITGGTTGQTALFKVEDYDQGNANAVEQSVELNGEDQEIEIDITKVLANEGFNGKLRLLIFPLPGASGEQPAGELRLKRAYFDKTEVVIPEKKNAPKYAAIWMDEVASHDNCYTVYKDTHLTTVDYKKTATGYESLLFKIEESEEWYTKGNEALGYNRIVGRIQSTVNVKVLLKPYDVNANERWLDLVAGVEQYVDFTVETSTVDLTKAFVVFICAGDGEQALEGRVFFDGLRIVRTNTNVGYDGDVVLDKVNSHDAAINFAIDEGDLVGTFDFAASGWHQIEMYVSAKDNTKYNEIVGTITSSVATSLIVKPQDNAGNEVKIPLEAGVPYELDHKFEGKLDQDWGKVLMSVSTDAEDGMAGTIRFSGLKLVINDPEEVSKEANTLNLAGLCFDNWQFASDCYYLRKTTNGVKVIVGQDKADGWENMQASIKKAEDWFDLKDYTKINLDVTSTVDTNILVKPYDNGAWEKNEGLTAGVTKHIEITIAPTNTDDLTKPMVVFIGTDGMAAGEVLIERFTLSRANANLEQNDELVMTKADVANPDNFAITSNEKGMQIEYHKQDGSEWDGIQILNYAHDFSELKVLHLKGTASNAVHLKFKLDGVGEEKDLVLTAGAFDETINFTNALDGKWNKLIVFVAYDAEDVKTGTVNLTEFYFAK